MSRHSGPICDENVVTYLLQALSEEDRNVVACEEKLNSCLAAVEHHTKRVLALRQALKALGAAPENPEVMPNAEL